MKTHEDLARGPGGPDASAPTLAANADDQATLADRSVDASSEPQPDLECTVEFASTPAPQNRGPLPHSMSDMPTLAPTDAASQDTVDVPSIYVKDGEFDHNRANADTLAVPSGRGPIRTGLISPDPGSSTRYTRTKVHAQGGLGIVWSVVDRTVGREVALKELRGERGRDPRVWAKFLQEARITGQLEHPGIVPIYEVAQNSDTGQPYYTMRFIKGKTLADACSEYSRNRAAGQDDPLAFRALLDAFVGVCQAVGFAHSRGVIHRDLKGQNVVLGDYGEAIVLDWGLAKVLGTPDDENLAPVSIGTEDFHQTTCDGQVLGTPTYMPPEQAEGSIFQIDRRSDIYSLGAILYEILTGQPPYVGGTVVELLTQVKQHSLKPPRQVDPRVPAPLETVCLKAMAKERDDRYQSATDLALEVQRYLADEPVLSYPEPWPARAARWARKHKTAVASAALLLVASVIGLSVLNVLVGRERDRVRAQREIARRAVDEMYTDVAEQWLEDQSDLLQQMFAERALASYASQAGAARDAAEPAGAAPEAPRADRVDAVQQAFLERSLAYYDEFASQKTDDARSSLDLAQARVRAANIHRKLGHLDRAEAGYRRAIAELTELAAANPNDPAIERALALSKSRFGTMLVTQGKFEESDALLAGAEKTFAKILASPSVSNRDRLEWGRVVREQAERLKLAGDTTAAEAQFNRAIAVLAGLVEKKYPGVEARHELALAQDALGVMLLLSLDREPDAAKLLDSAMAIEETLVREAPTVPHLRAGLAKTANTLSLIRRSEGKVDESLRAIDTSLASYQRLSDDFPGRLEYRRCLARSFLNRGNLDQDAGRVSEAADRYQKSIDLLTTLVEQAPAVAKHHRDLGHALNNLGAMREREGSLDKAVSLYERAIQVDQKLVTKYGNVPEYQQSLAVDQGNLARTLNARSQKDDAERAVALARLSLSTFAGLVKSYPETVAYQRGLAESQFQLGSIHLIAGRKDEAETLLRASVETHRMLLAKKGATLASRRDMINSIVNLAELGPDDAEALDREALAQIDDICKGPKASNGDRFTRAIVHNNLAEILEKKGKLDESAALFAQAAAQFDEAGLGGNEPQRLHYLAYVRTNQGKLSEGRSQAAEAVAFYRQAIDADRAAAKLSPGFRQFLLEDYNRLAAVLVNQRNHRGAADLAFEMVKALPEGSSARVEASGLLSRCMGLARGDTEVPEADRDPLARTYARKGLAQLRVAIDSGYKPGAAIKDNADIQKLLKEEDARSLLPDLPASE